ncbi:type 2 isopentenyl-diphosphate Delta-isomerase [uncultured Anaerococcus sp.]|uniref:type 2 isopentenyl-diphosphate Delta-isomerase n=1 Tax=uncultured Anaerococcus sp. TaxID=293428 RepID=UPI00288B41F7|nr:type 2 isopentenyl-diphosphate Delta-isomerase [uncultured Anaerococcus sp.]
MISKRRERKDEHIENYLKTSGHNDPLFDDIYLDHNSLSDINFDEIDTSIEFLGRKISMPLMVNAMTGGGELSADINEDLSSICQSLNIPMAVGSQTIGLEDEEASESFTLIKEKDLVRIGNLGAERSLEDFKNAAGMIDAHAIQIHLNVAQELFMPEGDKDFRGYYDNIKNLLSQLDVPIIVKETGNGLSKEVSKKLIGAGVKYLDVSGSGGTNFIEIEDMRDFVSDYKEFYNWGVPTAKAIIDARSLSKDVFIIGSGGIKTAVDMAKAIIIGADMTALSGEALRYLLLGSYEACLDYLKDMNKRLKIVMALLGVKNIAELKKVDYKLTGRLKDLVD